MKTLPGKAAVPDDHPLTTGGIGLLGTRPSEEAMDAVDTLLDGRHQLPLHQAPARARPGAGRCRSRPTPSAPATACRPKCRSSATPGATLRALLPLLHRKADRGFLTARQTGMGDWRAKMAALEDDARDPIAPQYLIA